MTVTGDETRVVAVAEARALGSLGFAAEESRIIADHLIDAALCGYDFAGLPRILTIAEDPRSRLERGPIQVVRETRLSLLEKRRREGLPLALPVYEKLAATARGVT